MWGGSPRSDVGPGGPTRARAPAPPSDCHCIVRDSIIALWMHSASLNNHGQRAIRARSKSPASTGRSRWSTIPTGAFIWRMVMSGPSQAKSPARTARRTTSSSVSRESRHWAVPEGAGRDLPDRVRLVRGRSRRPDRLAGHPAGGEFPAGPARGAGGARAFWYAPTVFWVSSSDLALRVAWIAGAALAIVLILGFFRRACLVALLILYLSISTAGQDFWS